MRPFLLGLVGLAGLFVIALTSVGPGALPAPAGGGALPGLVEAPQPITAVAGAAALAVALGAWWGARRWGRRRLAAREAPASTEARRQAAAAVTTARRAWAPATSGGLRALLWDVRGRRAVPLEGRHWTIGSDPACSVCVEGEGIAPLHARLSVTGDGLAITDLTGAGGTRLGLVERALAPGAPTPLAEGELIVLGRSLRLMVERVWAGPDGEP